MTSTIANLPAVPREDGLAGYLRQICKFPMLSADQEFMLAKRYHEHQDAEAAHELIASHLRLVAKIAMSYRGYGLPVSDLVAEGNIGLMRAVRKFDPDKGFRLSTYAMWWIRAAVTEYILHSWSMVKLGTMAAQKKLFFSLRKVKKKLEIFDNGELEPAQARRVAEELNVSETDAREMNRRLSARDFSLNTPMPKEDGLEYQDVLADTAADPEATVARAEENGLRREMLARAMQTLPARERDIIAARRLSEKPETLEALGARFGVSRERVRQLEVRAFDRLQKAILAEQRDVTDRAEEKTAAVRPD